MCLTDVLFKQLQVPIGPKLCLCLFPSSWSEARQAMFNIGLGLLVNYFGFDIMRILSIKVPFYVKLIYARKYVQYILLATFYVVYFWLSLVSSICGKCCQLDAVVC